MKLNFGLTLFGAAAVTLLAGCGGGGGGSSSGPLTFTQRAAVMTAINQMYQTLPGQDLNADNQKILAFVQGRPEFEASGMSQTGGVWARFTDGRLLVIANNRLPTLSGKAVRARDIPGDLPAASSPISLFVSAADFSTDTVNAIGARLQAAGYHGAIGDATLDQLRTVSNAAVFYIDCHGGDVMLRDGRTVFALQTDSAIGDTVDSALASDLQSNAIGYMMAPGPFNIGANTSGVKYQLTNTYFVTAQFVRNHMSFDPNSVAFVNACGSDSPIAADFKQAFFDKGAGRYLGWTKDVVDQDAQESAKYLFDRLLGESGTSSDFEAETPPQRPFDLTSVWQKMQSVARKDGRSGTLTESHQAINVFVPPVSGGDTANLTVSAFHATNSNLLMPTISAMTVFGSDLIIAGNFGNTPGKVTVDGTEVPADWGSGNITAHLPGPGQPGFAGDVIVTANGHKSNVAQLTMWPVKFHFVKQEQVSGTQSNPDPNTSGQTDYIAYSGGHTSTIDLTVYIRCDVRDPRGQPGQTPPDLDLEPQQKCNLTGTPNATKLASITGWSFSGAESTHQYSTPVDSLEETNVDTWSTGSSPQPPLSFDGSAPLEEHFDNGQVSYHHAAHTLMAWITARLNAPLHHQLTISRPGTGTSTTMSDTSGFFVFTVAQPNAMSQPYSLQLDSSYGIQAGQITYPNTSTTPYATYVNSVSWDATPAQFPPDPNAARSARRR